MTKQDISNYCRRMEARISCSGTPFWEVYGISLVLAMLCAWAAMGILLTVGFISFCLRHIVWMLQS